MATPGSNLLSTALTVVCRDNFEYLRFQGITNNEIGLDVRTYAAPVTRSGSIQAIDFSEFSTMGLDFNKSYIQIWTETQVNTVNRDKSGDQVIWNSRRFEVQSVNDWHLVDGWNHFTAVEVPTP